MLNQGYEKFGARMEKFVEFLKKAVNMSNLQFFILIVENKGQQSHCYGFTQSHILAEAHQGGVLGPKIFI